MKELSKTSLQILKKYGSIEYVGIWESKPSKIIIA